MQTKILYIYLLKFHSNNPGNQFGFNMFRDSSLSLSLSVWFIIAFLQFLPIGSVVVVIFFLFKLILDESTLYAKRYKNQMANKCIWLNELICMKFASQKMVFENHWKSFRIQFLFVSVCDARHWEAPRIAYSWFWQSKTGAYFGLCRSTCKIVGRLLMICCWWFRKWTAKWLNVKSVFVLNFYGNEECTSIELMQTYICLCESMTALSLSLSLLSNSI